MGTAGSSQGGAFTGSLCCLGSGDAQPVSIIDGPKGTDAFKSYRTADDVCVGQEGDVACCGGRRSAGGSKSSCASSLDAFSVPPGGSQEPRLSQRSPDMSGVGLDHLPMCPKVGCSYAFLHDFAVQGARSRAARRLTSQVGMDARGPGPSAELEDFTMGSVCARLIKPVTQRGLTKRLVKTGSVYLPDDEELAATQQGAALDHVADTAAEVNSSYAEVAMSMNMQDSTGQPAFGPATHFVSHAWSYNFASFVEAIGNWLEATGTPQEGTYFWVDAFVVNQHSSQEYPQEWWSTRFMQAVGEIGNTILVLEPWYNPVPFTRAWVIWELYCTSVTGARLHLTMKSSEMASFNETLVNSFEKVQTVLSSLDVSNSQAYHAVDQDMIHHEIKRTIGFTKLNELVQTRLMQWLTEAAQAKLTAMRGELESGRAKDASATLGNALKLQGNIARMLRESGNLAQAENTFRALLLQIQERDGGKDTVDLLSCMNQLAVTLQKANKHAEALTMHRECLERRRRLLGALHADTLQSTSNLAVLLSQSATGGTGQRTADFKEARALFEQALAGREKTLGETGVTTLYTVSSLARLLSEAPADVATEETFGTAEALHERAVTGLRAALHEAHPLTLSALHFQAAHWVAQLDFMLGAKEASPTSSDALRQAAEQFKFVAQMRTEKIGRQHPDTQASELAFRDCSRRLRKARRITNAGHQSWVELCGEEFQEMCTRDHFAMARVMLRHFGVQRLLTEFIDRNVVDGSTLELTTGMSPFNAFARLAAGVMGQPGLLEDQAALGPFQARFMVVRNRPECDQHWESRDPTYWGKASMSLNHRFLILKDLRWEWFNVLTFGLVSDLAAAIRLLKEIREAATFWVTQQRSGWPPVERVAFLVQVYAMCSVCSFHLHIVDLDNVGPTYEKMKYKNLPLDEVIAALELEAQAA